ncbi:Cytoplasmic phosphatidylinositol transfer protein 1 [Collichthys lucidus]|uniref:Cytoplasmic phosphatidylinositol transfer protein 1 n=1 Tax=Collichthys lucidus TaxID=240159 RepID=A0A4U5VT50_COLLU|nr:Cytoplasmic phosphatidylinositol transfer protein 1 [Collichthys lucidus]
MTLDQNQSVFRTMTREEPFVLSGLVCVQTHVVIAKPLQEVFLLQKAMLMKEYRICMPLTVEEYRIGQLYMISKHSHEQSERGEGVEVVQNEPYEDPEHGSGQFTEKRIYLNNKLPSWARAVVPKIFYITEKAWNYYPYTITAIIWDHWEGNIVHNEQRGGRMEDRDMRRINGKIMIKCSFLPKFSIHIETKYEDNKGSNDNIFGSEPRDEETEVWVVDIAYDEIPERHYKESESQLIFDHQLAICLLGVMEMHDLRYFKSKKTNRGVLQEGWINNQDPIMCSYKLVTVKFEVWGLQTRVEQFVHKVIRDVLLLGHRQAFAWVDEWIDMTMEEVREYERATQEATNLKIGTFPPAISISETPLPSSTRSGPNSAPVHSPLYRSPRVPVSAKGPSQEEVSSGDLDPAGSRPQGFDLQTAQLFLLELQSTARMRAATRHW